MKFETYAEYDPKGMALAVPALLTVWAGIQRFSDELVLVGGLVPHFTCKVPETNQRLPRPGTLDVDIGIALGTSSGQYGSLQSDLQAQGFGPSKTEPGRFEKSVGAYRVYLDFLAEHPPKTKGSVMVDDVPANVFPGIDRALATARRVTVTGKDLFGASQSFEIPVCDVGPYLVLKLRAFAGRQAPKDAFDILYTLLHHDRGTHAAAQAFRAEANSGNTAFADAMACLKRHFGTEDDSAPLRAAHFVYGEADTNEGDDVRTLRKQIQQDVVTLGKMLRGE